jgi:4-hydroxy-tetrahydrodipicolinate reductase
MKDNLKISVLGASGTMGSAVIREVLKTNDLKLHSVSEVYGHSWIGKDLGEVLFGKEKNITVSDDLSNSLLDCDVAIDFTQPQNTVACSKICAQLGVSHIIGTTGFSEKQDLEILNASKKTTIVKAGNMSLGINLLTNLIEKMSKSLDKDFDVEVTEMHHRRKVDAPSGTALMLGEAVATGRGEKLSDLMISNRDGITESRERGKIGFAALRGGGVIGEHEVFFVSETEKISIRHEALSRNIFVDGALKAAMWAKDKAPGLYNMVDVLEIE